MMPSSPTSSQPIPGPSHQYVKRTYGKRALVHQQRRKTEAKAAISAANDNFFETDDYGTEEIGDGAQGGERDRPVGLSPSARSRKKIRVSSMPNSEDASIDGETVSANIYHIPVSPIHVDPGSNGQHRPHATSQSPSSSWVEKTIPIAPSTPPRILRSLSNRGRRDISSPRDLSTLFDAVSPAKSASSRDMESQGSGSGSASNMRIGGLRRMLGKAQSMGGGLVTTKDGTATSRAPSTPSRALCAAQSLPITPSPNRAITGDSGASDASPTASPSVIAAHSFAIGSPGSGGRAKRTYGQGRSFLVADKSSFISGEVHAYRPDLSDEDEPVNRESYAELRKRYEVDNGFGDGTGAGNILDDLLLARAPQPVSDLRSKGENRRFMDEIAYLVEGIGDLTIGIGLKRSSSLDLLRNMQENGWASKMNLCGQTERVFEVLCKARSAGNDDIMEAVCLLFLVSLVLSAGSLENIVQSQAINIVGLVARNLNVRNGPLDRDYSGKATSALQGLRVIYGKLFTTDTEHEDCTRRAASFVLAAVCRESSWSAVESLIQVERVSHLTLISVANEISPMASRLGQDTEGADLLSYESAVDIAHLGHCLQALSAITTLSIAERNQLVEFMQNGLSDIANVVVTLAAIGLANPGQSTNRQAAQCVVLALQLFTSLASSSNELPSIFAMKSGALTALCRLVIMRTQLVSNLRYAANDEDDKLGGESEKTVAAVLNTTPDDICSLVLALIASIILSGNEMADLVANTRIAQCVKRTCVPYCQCNDARPFATWLVELYLEYQARSNEVLAGYLGGYLAFLLTKLLVLCPTTVERLILPGLPGSERRDKLDKLILALGELHSINVLAHRKLRGLQQPSSQDDGAEGTDNATPVDAETIWDDMDMLQEAMTEARALFSKGDRVSIA